MASLAIKALKLIVSFSHSGIRFAYYGQRHQAEEENLFEKVQLLILSDWIDQTTTMTTTTTLQIIAFRLAETTMWNNMVRHGALNIIKLVPCTFYYIILFNCVSNCGYHKHTQRTIVHSIPQWDFIDFGIQISTNGFVACVIDIHSFQIILVSICIRKLIAYSKTRSHSPITNTIQLDKLTI